jgi:hypothetical protein
MTVSSASWRTSSHIRAMESALAGWRAEIDDPDFLLSKDSEAYKKLRREPRLQQAIRHRQHLVAGRSWRIEPASASDDDKQAAALVTSLVAQVGAFTRARSNLAEACLTGLAVARIYGDWQLLDLGGGVRRWWAPTRLAPIDKRRIRLVRPAPGAPLRWEIRDYEEQEWVVLDRPECYVWHVYDDAEAGVGYGLGLGEALWHLWRSKTILLQYALQHAERWAHGVVEVGVDRLSPAVDGLTNAQIVENWLTLLPKQMSRHGLVHDLADKVTLLESDCTGAEFVLQLVRYHDDTAVSLILNSNLPTSVSSGGSYALADVQADSLESTILYDRELLDETLTRDLVGVVWRANLPTIQALGLRPSGCPAFATTSRRRKDIQVLQVAQQMGLPLLRSEVYEFLEFTPPAEGDDVLGGDDGEAKKPGEVASA